MGGDASKALAGSAILLTALAIVAALIAQTDVPVKFTNGLARGDCVTGDLAMNREHDNAGDAIPESRSFTALEEAQAFVCFRIPIPRETGPWRLEAVQAQRSHDLAVTLSSGLGFRMVTLGYNDERDSTQFRIGVVYGGGGIVSSAGVEELTTIQGVPATLSLGGPFPSFVGVTWSKDGLGFIVTAILSEEFTREDLVRILNSIR